ncbi:type IV secretion system protein [Thiotrichales bacterium 19S9-12]|nr:type IV secretion system protein [Thiotrichales bacterium 19S9-11]MCF6812173.1 type IV secretion system protein [Thiotrichales bacterium 19S9-12]
MESKKDTKAEKQYVNAYQEWNERIGSAHIQAKNWRLACLISILVILLLLVSIIMVISSQERYVYVAEVKPGEHVSNVKRVGVTVEPSKGQQIALIGNFIENIMSIPLDPVVLKKNWVDAFQMVEGQATRQLNHLMQKEKPFTKIGKVVQSTTVESVTQVSDNSFDVTWATKTIDRTGKTLAVRLYSGVFTLFKFSAPETLAQLFVNPTNMRIGYFSFNEKGSSR